jgi:hypothetical protein
MRKSSICLSVLFLLCAQALHAEPDPWVTSFGVVGSASSLSARSESPAAPSGTDAQSASQAVAGDVSASNGSQIAGETAAPAPCDAAAAPTCAPACADDPWHCGVMPFYAYLKYGDRSIKDSANVEGAYFFVSNSHVLLEFNGQQSDFAYRVGPDLSQQDYTTILTVFPTANFRARVGNHTISNDDPLRSNGEVWFGGLAALEKDRWEVGLDAYVSRYESYVPDPLTVVQITPRASFNITPTAWVDLRGYLIHTNNDLDLGTENFYSAEGRISKVFGSLTLSAYGYAGKQVFAVRNDGFVVWNLAEEHHAGAGGDAVVKFNDHVNFTVRLGDELFKDLVTQANTDVFMATFLLMFTY